MVGAGAPHDAAPSNDHLEPILSGRETSCREQLRIMLERATVKGRLKFEMHAWGYGLIIYGSILPYPESFCNQSAATVR